jgi:hypothetical protein
VWYFWWCIQQCGHWIFDLIHISLPQHLVYFLICEHLLSMVSVFLPKVLFIIWLQENGSRLVRTILFQTDDLLRISTRTLFIFQLDYIVHRICLCSKWLISYWTWQYGRLFEAEKRFAKVFSLNSIEIDLMKLSWELIQLNIFNRHFFYLTNMNETIDYCPNRKQKLDPMSKKNKSSLKGCQLCRQELYVIWNEHNGKRYDCRKRIFCRSNFSVF